MRKLHELAEINGISKHLISTGFSPLRFENSADHLFVIRNKYGTSGNSVKNLDQ